MKIWGKSERNVTMVIGAHRTASTHLQVTLEAHAAQLATHRTALVTPTKFRAEMKRVADLQEKGPKPSIFCPFPRHHLENSYIHPVSKPKSVLLMEENIIGRLVPSRLFSQSELYPFAEEGVALTATNFRVTPSVIALGIRAVPDFIESAWRHYCGRGGYCTPEQFLCSSDIESLTWAGLIHRLSAQFPNAKFVVWRYEGYPQNGHIILQHLIGSAASCVNLPKTRKNVSPSNQTLRWMSQSRTRDVNQLRMQARTMPKKSAADTRLMFNDEQYRSLLSNYERDCEIIAKLPFVKFIG